MTEQERLRWIANHKRDGGASASPTGAFVPDGIEPFGLDQRLQSPSVEAAQ